MSGSKAEGQGAPEQISLASFMRHELRTPINAIIGYSEMLLEDTEERGEEALQLRDDLASINNTGRELLSLVNDKSLELDFENFGHGFRLAIRTMINTVVGYTELLLEESEAGQGETFSSDLGKIHLAGRQLFALIDDFVKFGRLGPAADPPPPQDAAAPAPPAQAPAGAKTGPGEGCAHILVVDDYDMNRDLLSRHLAKKGYSFELAENGRRALDILAARPRAFDLVLLDMMMPELNGYETLRAIKNSGCLEEIPVIMLSAIDEIESVVNCLENGAEDYLTKPFEPALLHARINSCLRRKESERALRDSERRLSDIVNFLPDPTFVIDNAGKVLQWNHAIEEMTGVSAADMIGKDDYEYALQIYGERRPVLIDLVRFTREEIEGKYPHLRWAGDALIGEGRLMSQKGEIHFEGSAALLRNSQGEVVGSVETIRDMTDRKKAEEELEQAKEAAEAATRAKSMFLANMSHEIRTPMNAIIGMTYLALKAGLSPKQRDYVAKAHGAAEALLGIINDLLDFSKVEAGKVELEQSRFLLEEVLCGPLNLLRERAHEKEIELILDIADPRLMGDNCALLGDPLRLGQIITNLLSNALKFTHQGYVRISVEVEARHGDDLMLCFTMRDTGIGLTDEQVGRLFQEFTQADGSTTRKYGGTGLGLTISKKFVELMGGRIRVESAPGEGSSFSFTARFPMAEPGRHPVAVAPDLERLRVLVLDGRPQACRALAGQLAALGVAAGRREAIDCAADAAGALALVRQALDRGSPYDLLLLDWALPQSGGARFLEALNDSLPDYRPVSAVVSAYDSDKVREVAERLGAPLFLRKPVLPEALRRLLNYLTGADPCELSHNQPGDGGAYLNGMRVLLVEDNPINRQLAVELMECRGVEVTVAGNGREALERLAEVAADHYHVVCMDLQMPIMDGYEATRRLRAESRYDSLPIIAMTAHAMAEERERCKALGMNGHLSKPIEPDLLYATLAGFHRAPEPTAQAELKGAGESAPAASMAAGDLDLPEIAGLDTSAGLRRAGNNQALYLKLLARFAADHADSRAELCGLMENGDWETAERQAHTLKGLSATLGMGEIETLAGRLEADCKNRSEAAAGSAMMLLAPALGRLTGSLDGFFASKGQAAAATGSAAGTGKSRLPDCLPRLLEYLGEGDSDALDLWEAHQQEFADSLPPQVALRIGTALQNYEFDTAHALLAELQPAVQPL